MLTPRQTLILSYLRQRHAARRPPPSIREIAAACHVPSTSTVVIELDRLAQAGYLVRERDSSRGIMLKGEQGAEAGAEWADPARVVELEAEVKRLKARLMVSELAVRELRRKLQGVER